MAVVLPDRTLAVRTHAHPYERDAYGVAITPLAGEDAEPVWGPALPGAAKERDGADESTGTPWSLRLDPSLWPLNEGDHVTDGEHVWAITHAKLVTIPGYRDVDYIAATGLLHTPKRV